MVKWRSWRNGVSENEATMKHGRYGAASQDRVSEQGRVHDTTGPERIGKSVVMGVGGVNQEGS